MPKRLSDAPEPRQSVNWVFTVNNWIDGDKDEMRERSKDPLVKRLVWQEEICPTTGTPHLQGYVILSAKKTKLGLAKWMLRAPERWKQFRTRPCYSDVVNSEVYCSNQQKLGAQNYEEHGQELEDAAGHPDTKEDRAKEIIHLAEKGDWATLKSDYPTQYLYCHTQLKKVFYAAVEVPETHDGVLDNYWVFGAPGAGKDQWIKARLAALGVPYYKKPANNKWWNEYAGESVVWYQDLGKRARDLDDEYKLWLDRDKQLVDTKHGMVWCNPATSYISSQHHPSVVFTDPDALDAIMRRVQVIEIIHGRAIPYRRENVLRPPLAVLEDERPDPKRQRHDPPSPDRFTSLPERF